MIIITFLTIWFIFGIIGAAIIIWDNWREGLDLSVGQLPKLLISILFGPIFLAVMIYLILSDCEKVILKGKKR